MTEKEIKNKINAVQDENAAMLAAITKALVPTLTLLGDMTSFVAMCCQTGDINPETPISPMTDSNKTVAETLAEIAEVFKKWKKISKKEIEITDWKKEFDHLSRKVEHGCTDFSCKICDDIK